jgi:hypothetical protein
MLCTNTWSGAKTGSLSSRTSTQCGTVKNSVLRIVMLYFTLSLNNQVCLFVQRYFQIGSRSPVWMIDFRPVLSYTEFNL